MKNTDWVMRMFQAIDRRDPEAFLEFLSDDVFFRFGNPPPVLGKAKVAETLRALFGSIKALRHTLNDTWQLPGTAVCHGTVTYSRHDSSTLTVPFADILKLDGPLISEYLVFIDASALYATA